MTNSLERIIPAALFPPEPLRKAMQITMCIGAAWNGIGAGFGIEQAIEGAEPSNLKYVAALAALGVTGAAIGKAFDRRD